MGNSINKITKSEQKLALSSLKYLSKSQSKALKRKSKTVMLRVDGSDEIVEIPLKALKLFTTIVSKMAEGKSVSLFATETELTTQQAANILNVSRPHLVKLLEIGEIAFIKVGSHRRILLEDILKYESKLKKERRSGLNSLAKEAQKLNLGY